MEKKSVLDVTILCKVVDNFGDIGVVYRLAKKIEEIESRFPVKLRIVVDNLDSFHLLCPKVNPQLNVQIVNNWQIFRWDAQTECLEAFKKNPPQAIVECFQCGRPDWLEELLFNIKVENIVNIFMLDYLTAEDYAETFHCLQSLTRSARVQKVNFMPGFTAKTGGLLLDKFCFQEEANPVHPLEAVFFSYPKDWSGAVKALSSFNEKIAEGNLKIKLAKGAGFESFKKSWESFVSQEGKKPFELEELSFIPQEEWDEMLFKTPLLFIRGEDSLSRACLYGHPFIWHAYPQTEDYQLVKVQALLDQLKPHFSEELFKKIESCWLIYNGKEGNLEKAMEDFLLSYNELVPGFKSFSNLLVKNGDLGTNLMTFIEKKVIIKEQTSKTLI